MKNVPLIGAGVALTVYGLTLHPSLPGGDAGELASAACAGGIAHPPGYPLHGLLLRLIDLVPLGSHFQRFNALSALCGALTVGLLVHLVTAWTSRPAAGLLAGAAWLMSPLAWRYATSLEVFSLHTALLTLFGVALTRDLQRDGSGGRAPSGAPPGAPAGPRAAPRGPASDALSSARARGRGNRAPGTAGVPATNSPGARAHQGLLLGLSAGLALTHHPTSLFVVGPLLALRALRHPARGRLALGLLLGALPLLLLPRWSANDTPFSWGDLRTVAGFLTHVLRREYGTFQLAAGGEVGLGLPAFLQHFASFELHQLFGLIALLALAGVAAVWRSRRARAWLLAGSASFALCLLLFGALANLPLDDALFRGVVARFFLMPHLLLCAAAPLALGRRAGLALVPVLVLGLVTRPRPDGLSVRAYGQALLAQPAEALVLSQGDLISGAMRALQACDGEHAALQVVDQQLLTWPWYVARLRRAMPGLALPPGARWHPSASEGFTLEQLLTANAARPIIVCGGLKPGDPTRFRAVPWGPCERLLPPGAPFDEEAWFQESAALLPSLELVQAGAAPGSWDALVARDVWGARARRGLTALQLGIARGDDRTWLTRAYEVLQDVATRDVAPDPSVLKNLGIAAGRLGRTEEMRRALRRYISVAPADDAELPSVRALIGS